MKPHYAFGIFKPEIKEIKLALTFTPIAILISLSFFFGGIQFGFVSNDLPDKFIG